MPASTILTDWTRLQVGALRAHVAEKESGLAAAQEENARLKSSVGMYQKEVERLNNENRILKRAVGIQNTKGKEVKWCNSTLWVSNRGVFVVTEDFHLPEWPPIAVLSRARGYKPFWNWISSFVLTLV